MLKNPGVFSRLCADPPLPLPKREGNQKPSADMNKQQIEQLWEAHRDGSISETDRVAFEQHLRESEPAAAMWKAESQWLEMIGDVDASFDEASPMRDRTTFVASVLDHWQVEAEREQLGVVATIGPVRSRRPLGFILGLAAMLAILLLGGFYFKLFNPSNNTTNPNNNVVVAPPPKAPETPAAPDAPDAIGLLFASAKDSYAVAAAQPARIKQGFSSTAAFLDVSNLTALLDPGIPDPADFVEPKAGG